jgi:NAD(P)-dependent dehydrogenase (short-subunit alcohol dehydrogenase family)
MLAPRARARTGIAILSAVEPSALPLAGRVALVLGAGSSGPGWGNGKASAVAYARAGARVACVDVVLDRADETARIIREESGDALALAADVTSSADVHSAIETTVGTWGQLDILHNNVGISLFGGAVELSEADWDRSIDTNLKSVFLACKYALPIMERQSRGVITNISSILSVRISWYDQVAYYASKAAVDHLTRAIAIRYAAKGIRANAILPGLIDTPLLYANPDIVMSTHGGADQMVEARDAASPTGKQGTAWDVANAAVFLASDSSRYINGVTLPVDGGLINLQSTTRPAHA